MEHGHDGYRWTCSREHGVLREDAGREVQVEALPVTRQGGERMTVPWEQLTIAGVVAMAFRTVFQIPGSGGAVRAGEPRALSADDDLSVRPEAWSTS